MVADCKTVRIFAYSRTREQSNKRSGTRLKTESEQRLERFERETLTSRFSDFFTDFEEKTDCFAVYRGRNFWMGVSKTRGRVRVRVRVRVDNPNPKTAFFKKRKTPTPILIPTPRFPDTRHPVKGILGLRGWVYS